jgi:hypothetical protein
MRRRPDPGEGGGLGTILGVATPTRAHCALGLLASCLPFLRCFLSAALGLGLEARDDRFVKPP